MKELAVTIGNETLRAPSGIPSGGLSTVGSDIGQTLILLLFIIAAVLAVIFIILGGIRWIISGGDPKAIEGARKQITYAIIGLVVVFLAFLIVNQIGKFLRVTLLP